MLSDRKKRVIIEKSLCTILLFIGGIICILPLIWMISTSFKYEIDVFKYPIEWIPKRWNFKTYERVLIGSNFHLYYWNTIKVTVISCVGNLLFSAITGYAFGRIRFKGANTLFLIYLASIMIPNQVVLVPKYILYRLIGLYDTHWSLIMPELFAVFSVFLYRQAFKSIPYDFTEAALIDGAGHIRIFWQIILPMVKSTTLTLALLNFNRVWNDYISPRTFITTDERQTIPVGLQNFQLSNSSSYSTIMAGTAMSLIPIILVFLTVQKHLVNSFISTGIKG